MARTIVPVAVPVVLFAYFFLGFRWAFRKQPGDGPRQRGIAHDWSLMLAGGRWESSCSSSESPGVDQTQP